MSRYIDLMGYDVVVLETDRPYDPKVLRSEVEKQLKENGIVVLPFGVKAKVVRRDKCVVKGAIDGEIH